MSIIEATKSMLDVLPESDIRVIYTVTKNIFDKETSPFKPLSRAQILQDLDESSAQIENGEYLDFEDSLREIEVDCGL